MQSIKEAADEFLRHKRVAVTGVSRNAASHGSNVVYQRLKERGYEVFAVIPNTAEVEGDQSYPSLASIPGGVTGSVSKEATDYGREHGLTVIDGGCPLMFDPVSDQGHKVMRWMFSPNGHVPRRV